MAGSKKSTFQRLSKGQASRKQRRELERRLQAEDPGLEIVNRNVAGIDVGNESHFVAVPPGRDAKPVQEFGSWTADLERMAEWLKACAIEKVVMQSTGVYWIALFDLLEAKGFQVCLANARYTKNLPGRKSDGPESNGCSSCIPTVCCGTPFVRRIKSGRYAACVACATAISKSEPGPYNTCRRA